MWPAGCPSSVRICSDAVVKADHRHMHRGAVEDPVAVGPGQEDVAGLFDAFENGAVVAAADALGGEEADTEGMGGSFSRRGDHPYSTSATGGRRYALAAAGGCVGRRGAGRYGAPGLLEPIAA